MKNQAIAQEDLILHGVKITHPDRIVFAEGKITKEMSLAIMRRSRRCSCETYTVVP